MIAMSKEISGLFHGTSGSKKGLSNKFSDKVTWPSKLEEGKQGKHIEGHPNYISGKSKLTITMKEAAKLVEKFSSKGKIIGNSDTSNKERVNFGKIIGVWIDKDGNEHSTSIGIIHHSKNGTHIVPSDPNSDSKGD